MRWLRQIYIFFQRCANGEVCLFYRVFHDQLFVRLINRDSLIRVGRRHARRASSGRRGFQFLIRGALSRRECRQLGVVEPGESPRKRAAGDTRSNKNDESFCRTVLESCYRQSRMIVPENRDVRHGHSGILPRPVSANQGPSFSLVQESALPVY